MQLSCNNLLQTTRELIGNINLSYVSELVHAKCASEHTVSGISQAIILIHPHSPVLHTRIQRMLPHSTSLVRHGCGTSTSQHDLHTRVHTITPTEYDTARPPAQRRWHHGNAQPFYTQFPACSLARCALVCLPGLTERGSKVRVPAG